MFTTGFYVVRLATRRSDGSTTCLHVAQEGLRAGLVTEREKKFLPLLRTKLRFLVRLCVRVLAIATTVSRISATLSKVRPVYWMRTWIWLSAIPRVLVHENLHRVTSNVYIPLHYWYKVTGKKGKAIRVQAWTGLEGSRRLRLPDCKRIGTWKW
jgi:hypothetical protein